MTAPDRVEPAAASGLRIVARSDEPAATACPAEHEPPADSCVVASGASPAVPPAVETAASDGDASILTWRDAADQTSGDVRYGLAFSGGCDSSFLLASLMRAGRNVKAYMVMTAFQATFELDDARRVVEETGAPFELIFADVLANDEVCANPPDRCYRCKRFIFGTILEHMARDGRTVLLDGTNATDDPARRPGFRALAELGVVSPLRVAGFTKDQVRAASRAIGLSTADKPNFSCFATKVPTGAPITGEAIEAVARPLGLTSGSALM